MMYSRFFVFLFSLLPAIGLTNCLKNNCMIVVDSGSTGSRAHLYQYQTLAANKPIVIKELKLNKVAPGLAKLKLSDELFASYLAKLFDGLGQSEIKLPVYYYATAGMRLLSQSEQTARYNKIKTWFSSQEKFELADIGTISGQNEGVYGWLAVNYLSGNFTDPKPHKKIGMMDFGGASIQVAYQVDVNKTTAVEMNDIAEVSVAGKRYHIFSKSFLGMGLNEVTHQYLDDPNCYAQDYPLPDGQKASGDVHLCEQDIEVLSNRVHHLSQLKSLNLASKVDKWVGLGAIGYLHNSKPFKTLSSPMSMAKVSLLAQTGVCHQLWAQLEPSAANDPYLYNTCLSSAYFYAVIVNGYGLNENTAVYTEVNHHQSDIDWTVGVVLSHMS